MNIVTSSSDWVHLAYHLLKQDTYYDKMDLFLYTNAADYEASDSFRKRQNTLATIVDELRKGHQARSTSGTMHFFMSPCYPMGFPDVIVVSYELQLIMSQPSVILNNKRCIIWKYGIRSLIYAQGQK